MPFKNNDRDGYLKALVEEVINNGYKYDLCLECKQGDECKHDDYSILQIVDDKLKHIRHKAMDSPLRRDHMLSLILYTGFVFIVCFVEQIYLILLMILAIYI